MSSSPSRPGEVAEHEKRVLEECARTFDEDIKEARPADEVMRELREKFKPSPETRSFQANVNEV